MWWFIRLITSKTFDGYTVKVPDILRPLPHSYYGYYGPFIEKYFYTYWCSKRKELEKDTSFEWIYVPIFWTECYIKYGIEKAKKLVQEYVLERLNKNRKYFTLIQYADGFVGKAPDNLQVFGSGEGDVPIPLLEGNSLDKCKNRKDIQVSFMGRTTGANDRTGVRGEMLRVLKEKQGYYFGLGDIIEFWDVTKRSVFTLCPRGYGRTSYRLYEAMSVGSIPIYIWDDVEWLPYKNKLKWNDFIISINVKDLQVLPDLIEKHNDERILKKIRLIETIYPKYFTLNGACERIMDMLIFNDFDSA